MSLNNMGDYDFLNERQKEAVFHTEGPLLILAGAGSGKTSVLTNRLGYMIREKKIAPSSIMAITFTNKAAREMQERAKKIAGESAKGVWISTFHSSCVKILRDHAYLLGYKNKFTIYDTNDSIALIKQILKKLNVKPERGEVKDLLSNISKAKRKMLNPTEYALAVQDDYSQKKSAIVYREYQSLLYKSNAMDFDDLIFNTILLFRRYEKVLAHYQNNIKYIMVDEYQDTDLLQFELISKLAEVHKNICAVGDDNQSIYKFRGADIRNILTFEKVFPNTTVIKLEENFRSYGNILNAANAVVENNKVKIEKKLWTKKGDGDLIHFSQLEDALTEANQVIRKIAMGVEAGRKYSDYAILYRMNAQSRSFEEAFVKANIPYEIAGGISFYERKEIKDLLAYLHVIENPNDDLFLKRIINIPKREIGKTTLEKLQSYADVNKMSLFESISAMLRDIPKLKPFYNVINKYNDKLGVTDIETILRTLIVEIKYINYIMKLDPDEGDNLAEDRIRNIHEFLNKTHLYIEEHPGASLNDFLIEISLLSDIDALKEQKEKVVLMTVHSSKGLEFPVVFMSGMEDGVFPMSRCICDAEELEEERRLAYVAITRAKEELYISCVRKRMINGNMIFGYTSRFVCEIPKELLDNEVSDSKNLEESNNDDTKLFLYKKHVANRNIFPFEYTCLCGGKVTIKEEKGYLNGRCNKCGFTHTDIVTAQKDASYIDEYTCLGYIAGSFNEITMEYGSAIIFCRLGKTEMYKAKDNKQGMATLKSLAGEMNAAIFAIKLAIKSGYKNITVHYNLNSIESLINGTESASTDEMQYYVHMIFELRGKINIYFAKDNDDNSYRKNASIIANKVVENTNTMNVEMSKRETMAISYGVSLKCIDEIRKFNSLSEKEDDDYLSLKTYGLDQLSQYTGEAIRKMILQEDLSKIIRAIIDPASIDSCIRWYLRGLSIEDSIKKIQLQLENR